MAEGPEVESDYEHVDGLVYREQEVAGKGVGCVATRRIKKGSLLFREKPVFNITTTIMSGEEDKTDLTHFGDLTSEDQTKYLRLYNVYDCSNSEWSNEMKSDLAEAMIETSNMMFPGSGISQEKATRIWQIFHSNSYPKGVYLKMSRFNHSCRSNVDHFWNTATETRDLMVMREIKKGEEITLNYRPADQNTKEVRQGILKESFNFFCSCEVCDITEDEIQKEVNNYDLFREEKKRRQEGILTYESVIREAECLKRMYRLARDLKAFNRMLFLCEIVEELFDVSCQGYLSAGTQRGNRETEKAKWMKDVKMFAATGLKLATTLFGEDGVPLRENGPEAEVKNWKARERDPIKYFRKEYGGAIKYF